MHMKVEAYNIQQIEFIMEAKSVDKHYLAFTFASKRNQSLKNKKMQLEHTQNCLNSQNSKLSACSFLFEQISNYENPLLFPSFIK